MRQISAEQLERRVNVAAAAQYARPDGDGVECLAVPAERKFVGGGAADVLQGVGRKAFEGQVLVVAQVHDAGGYRALLRAHGWWILGTEERLGLARPSGARRRSYTG